MILTSTLFVAGAAAVAVFDRMVLTREKIDVLELGHPVVRDGFLDFPIKYINSCRKLKGACVEYWLYNDEDPAHVLSGKMRTLDLAHIGLNSEYLSFKREYLIPGDWTFAVRVTHGDCRWNPLYRLFPVQTKTHTHLKITGEQCNGK